jgi:hypothetical protein
MSTVFISYRRETVAGEARALFNNLVGRLGEDCVFMDVDSIALGRDFRSVLQKTLDSSDLMLVLIGKNWADIKDEEGQTRLENPGDFVRLEIEAALKRDIVVTPILVQGAHMPAPEQLPEEIRDLAYRNWFELSHNRWESDVSEMIRRLSLEPPQTQGQAEEKKKRTKPFRLPPSFENGIYGGVIGGSFSGLFIGVAYFVKFSSLDKSVTWIDIPVLCLYCAFSGMLLGAFPQLFILWFDYLVTEKQHRWLAFNKLSGGLVGGVISGVPIGIFAALFFGWSHDYFVGTDLLIIGSVISVIFVTAGVLFYTYRRLWRNVIRAFITSLLIIACTSAVAVFILQRSVDPTAWFFFGTNTPNMTLGGAILGAMIGVVAGVQIGLTLALYRLWEPTEQGDPNSPV